MVFKQVSVPIWSEINGQDDIIWYMANRQNNGTYTVNVKASAHKTQQAFIMFTFYYVQKDGQLTGVGGTTQVFGNKMEISVFANLSTSKMRTMEHLLSNCQKSQRFRRAIKKLKFILVACEWDE